MFNIDFQELSIILPGFLFALTIHEFSHGYVAYLCGDPTAKYQGRLTLNPLKHLDPLGTFALVFLKFGWAKPVPVDPRNFRNPHTDMIKVAIAGPASNVLTAIASFLIIAILINLPNSVQAASSFLLQPILQMLKFSFIINIVLAIFNMLPVPPLDGSKVLMGILPPSKAQYIARLEGYGFMILLALLFFTGAFTVVWAFAYGLFNTAISIL